MLGPFELVVRRAGHHPALQLGDGVVPDDGSHGARGEDVAFLRVDLVRIGGVHTEVAHDPRHGVHVDVAGHHAGLALLHQQLHQVVAHLPHALHGHPPPFQ